ncbi:hypothetical protein [Brevibacillus parabrevis]|uniref:hypothetical protein n=1 Tax=Brevibacillus parabrevis TaxID=54914 RepID=UPI0028D4421D|nr:hypothetical protein [Brevibacillus parabrevis]
MYKLGMKGKKWLLFLHLLFSAIMLGGAVLFLVLSIVAANTDDAGVFAACYTAMHTLAKTSVRASTIGTIVTGVLLSVWTHWGLFRYYWLIAKEVLTLVTILLGPVAMYVWTLPAVSLAWAQGLEAMGNPAFIVNSEKLWIGIVLQLLSLILLFLLSVFKPWGKRKS